METKRYFCDLCGAAIDEQREPGARFLIQKESLLDGGGVARTNSILTVYASILRPGSDLDGPLISLSASHVCVSCAREIQEYGDLSRAF